MTGPAHVTLRVELDPQGDSISGRVLDGAGRSFSGWVGPAAAIEAASEAPAGDAARVAQRAGLWMRRFDPGRRHAKGGLR